MLLAAINTIFSLLDPTVFGEIIDYIIASGKISKKGFVLEKYVELDQFLKHSAYLLFLSVCVAMISRIAKSFQDYVVNRVVQKFGAKVFTDGLQQSMRLPYQDFADQRSGETLNILQKVRQDCSQFIGYFKRSCSIK